MTNPKGDLIDFCRANGLPVPVFETWASGPEHEPTFTSEVAVGSALRATGQGRTKRDSERAAASAALEALAGEALPPGASPAPEAGLDPEGDGPWPIFPDLLAESLAIANERVDPKRLGPQAIDEVRRLALDLYKGLLEELGEYA